MPLSDLDASILSFHRRFPSWQFEGMRESAVRERFGLSLTRFWQETNRIIDMPEAMASDPLTCRRLQRVRASRQRSRSARRVG